MSDSIEVRDLRIAAGTVELVRGVSFAAPKGQVTGLIGESGSGKSLTCQTVLGLLPKGLSARGEVRLDGRGMPLGGDAASRKARGSRVAMIMQNPASCFDPVFTIASHFKETLAAHGFSRDENRPEAWVHALGEVGFPQPEKILGLFPFQMSGGMLQRVMIALALVLKADFLIADEATTDLDAVSQSHVLDLLEQLVRSRGVGVLLVTHDLSVIARLAGEVLVMHAGRIVERGRACRVFHEPAEAYTASLLQAHYRLYGLDLPGGCAPLN